MAERAIDFFYDLGSSYSYLASTQIERLERDTGWTVRHRPFLLGGVFKATGNASPVEVPAKARWVMQDVARWAAEYGVPVATPSRFPMNTLVPQRALTAASLLGGEPAIRSLTAQLMRAFWVEDQDIASPEVIERCAHAAELDSAPLLERLGTPEVKDRLRATTDEALSKGAFGAPSFVVGDELFWGNDRIPQLVRHLSRLR